MKDATKPNKRLNVLVVEDEARLRDILVSAIPDMGFSCRAVRSGEDALERMASGESAELLLVDLNLPGINGLEFLERVYEQWPSTCAVVMTGYGDLPTAQRAIRLDVADFLTKPASLGDIERALERARQVYWRRAGVAAPEIADLDDERSQSPPDSQSLAALERQHILAILDRHQGNRAATAAELGISLRTLYYRLAEFQRDGYLSP